ncbi:methylated-DNA--[protein]-cysteine S-methyltransferase [Actinokineospora sp.]|uniref:methylated-DNA--[protein]-cysteine S-methyltransferase n=1 Tax=Actinokineospora sp. TaxID=1872133 RepID=UPI004037FBE6
MMVNDPVVDALGGLAAAPARDLLSRVFSNWTRVPGPVGDVYVAFTDEGVSYLRTADAVHGDDGEFGESFRREFGRPLRRADRAPAGLLPALRGRASGLRFDLRHLTPFERDVLAATRRIPAGQTRPYGWVAREIGRPKAVRAVGTALGNNPVPVLIPCHRVVRSDGQLGQYVFGGEVKERLLRVEESNVDEVLELARGKVFYLGSTTTRIVCFPTCAHARRIGADHRRGFRTMAAAASAGYRPCLHCTPA